MSQSDEKRPEGEKREPFASRWRAVRWLAGLVRPYRGRLLVACAATMLSGAVSLAVPHVAGRIVDAALVERSLESMKLVLLGMLGLFAVSAVLAYTQTVILRSTSSRLVMALRGRLHAHMLGHSPAFFERERVGDLLSRLTSDVGTIGGTLTSDLTGGLQQTMILFGAIVILFVKAPQLTGIMLLAVPPVVLAAAFFGARFQKLGKQRQKRAAEATVAAEESFAGIRTVVAFVREDEERKRYAGRLDAVLEIALRAARVWGAFGALVNFFAFGAITLVLWYGGQLLIRDELSPGQLTSFLIYTVQVAGATGGLASVWGGLSSTAGATDRVQELLKSEPEIVDAPDALALPRPRGRIAFEGVRFVYPTQENDRPAIDGIDLAIEPGEVVALVGPSGGGKSTLVALLLRFHDPQEGCLRLDDFDVRRLRLADLRGAIGLVPQDIFLFGGSVAENIRYGRADASDDEVREAARAAHADAFVSALPQGYETLVGERGVRLSVGERQRIAIARVFLKNPAVVVLDEATSSLDAESEHLVQSALQHLFEGRTTLVVAHRLATVRRANRVVLLDAGRVVEEGTHAELASQNGLYRRFCDLQMLET